MTTHDLDSRYADPDARSRVAVLYLPLLGIVMDTIPQLHSYLNESHDNLQNFGYLEDYQGPQNCKNQIDADFFRKPAHFNQFYVFSVLPLPRLITPPLNYTSSSCHNNNNQLRCSICHIRQSSILLFARANQKQIHIERGKYSSFIVMFCVDFEKSR